MIRLNNVNREYPTLHGRVKVLKNINFHVNEGEKIGILGRNGAGKSTLIRIISGAERPNSGTIEQTMSVSWPLAFAGGFQNSLTGMDNLRFICRIYGKDWHDELAFVDDFTELGRFLREPIGTYSSGMRSRLAFALSMVVDFDCFLIDEVMAVGDHRFYEKCHYELFEKRGHKAMIFVSHDPVFIRERCDKASVLKDGFLHNFDDLEHAFHYYYSDTLPPQPSSTLSDAEDSAADAQQDTMTIDHLLFGRPVPHDSSLIGKAFAEWVFSHPLNSDPEVVNYRLNTQASEEGLNILARSFTHILPADYSWRSIHSVLAAYAEDMPDSPAATNFLDSFENGIAVEGPDGLWEKMAAEGGSIHRIKTFEHKPTGKTLPIRLDFFRLATEDHVRTDLAEFTISDKGVRCTLQICHLEIYAHRLFSIFPFVIHYLETCNLDGHFSLSLGDEGLNERILSFCAQTPDFLVPDALFIATAGYAFARDAYGEARPWAQREDKAYWRGTDTGVFRYKDLAKAPRVVISHASEKHPELLDAKITQVEIRGDWGAKQDYYTTNNLMGEAEPQDRILDFKYQIDVDGNTNSWPGLFLKLLSGSPVLKVESEFGFRQWYYHLLEPWKNYVPVESDASDILEKLTWLREHPAEAEEIGKNGRELALSITYDKSIDEAAKTIERLVRINKRLSSEV